MSVSKSIKKLSLEKIILPIADMITRQNVMNSYHFFRESQWWSYEKLCELQDQRLRETIRIAYDQVPFYREHYDQHGIELRNISLREDLAKIPPVSKTDLKNSYPDRCVRKTPHKVREFFTSGSSGSPFAVKIDSTTLSDARALMFLRANFSGWQIGDSILQTGMSLDRGIIKKAKDIILGVNYVSAFNLSDEVLDQYLGIIQNKNLKYLMGYPGSIYYLARRAKQVGFDKNLLGIVCWGDNLYHHYRQEIETVFGCRVTDTYGCGEGIQVAAQCEEGNYHIFMPHVLVEVVDDDGYPVKKGNQGNILLTRLDAGTMPLIRYRVGDIGKMSRIEICPCGRGLEILQSIDGRDSDVIITPRGNRLIVHFFTGIFEYFSSIDTFKITQEEINKIRVEIVPSHDFEMGQCEQIKKEILEKGDSDLEIEMVIVKNIPIENSNKRRFVVSKLKSSDNVRNID